MALRGAKRAVPPIAVRDERHDEASPRPPSKRQQRSMQRLLDFQQKKRDGFVAELVANGCSLENAQSAVANAESMRLKRIAAGRATPMEAEAAPAPATTAFLGSPLV